MKEFKSTNEKCNIGSLDDNGLEKKDVKRFPSKKREEAKVNNWVEGEAKEREGREKNGKVVGRPKTASKEK